MGVVRIARSRGFSRRLSHVCIRVFGGCRVASVLHGVAWSGPVCVCAGRCGPVAYRGCGPGAGRSWCGGVWSWCGARVHRAGPVRGVG